MFQKPRVVAIADNAPYLGGPLTWQPLRDAAKEYGFDVVDPLDYTGAADYASAIKAALSAALQGASAAIAHGSTAALAIEAVSAVDPELPLILLEPRLVRRDSSRVRILRRLLTGRAGGTLLTLAARKKYRRLLRDRAFVRKQLEALVRPAAIDDALLDEACARIASPESKRAVDRTVDAVAVILRPADSAALARVEPRATLVGPLYAPAKARAYAAVERIECCRMTPMLDAPAAVAGALRRCFPPPR